MDQYYKSPPSITKVFDRKAQIDVRGMWTGTVRRVPATDKHMEGGGVGLLGVRIRDDVIDLKYCQRVFPKIAVVCVNWQSHIPMLL